MSFVALLDHGQTLARLLAQGQRPLAVVSRQRAITAAACAEGIPALHADELLTRDERIALQDHVDDLTAALAGPVVPTGPRYADWAWWALEYPLAVTLSHGARLRMMLD